MSELLRARGPYGKRLGETVVSRIAGGAPIQVYHEDSMGEKIAIETVQDVSPILEANAQEYNSGHDGYTPSRDMRKVAEIPLVEVQRLMQEGINIFDRGDWPKIAAKLDDPDWQKFRTAPGRISKRPTREFYRASSGS